MDLALVVIVFQLGFENGDAHKSTSLMLVTEGDGALQLFLTFHMHVLYIIIY